jgi:HSP20 family molecular chaperone IbpA
MSLQDHFFSNMVDTLHPHITSYTNRIFRNCARDLDNMLHRKSSSSTDEVDEPHVNVNDDGSVEFVLALPGMSKNDVTINVSDDRIVSITASKKYTAKHMQKFSKYSHTFTLPDTVDVTTLKAHLEHGLLSLFVAPRTELQIVHNTRTIPIA